MNDEVSIPFVVGPLTGVEDGWKDDAQQSHPPPAPPEWAIFFTKLRSIRYAKPGGLYCRGTDCGKSPDSPPPDLVGMASSGSSGGIGVFAVDGGTRYAQAATAPIATDATAASPERRALITDLANRTCKAVQLLANKPASRQ